GVEPALQRHDAIAQLQGSTGGKVVRFTQDERWIDVGKTRLVDIAPVGRIPGIIWMIQHRQTNALSLFAHTGDMDPAGPLVLDLSVPSPVAIDALHIAPRLCSAKGEAGIATPGRLRADDRSVDTDRLFICCE